MSRRAFSHAVLALVLFSGASPAADLTKIDRTIRKEPAYRGKPKYCLLVFGPEAATRVWLALDGETLYVDRDGDGDLTGKGEAITATKVDARPDSQLFTVDPLAIGSLRHRNLRLSVSPLVKTGEDDGSEQLLAKDPSARSYMFLVDLELPGQTGSGIGGRVEHNAGSDSTGYLQLAADPKDAPVVHFGGPWQMTLAEKKALRLGREHDFRLGIGTPGLGIGSMAFLGEGNVIPKDAFPNVNVEYPPRDGEAPLRERYELKYRC